MVIYKIFGVYHVTTLENYNAAIQDARKIQKLADFSSAAEIIDYYCKWFGCNPTDFTIL